MVFFCHLWLCVWCQHRVSISITSTSSAKYFQKETCFTISYAIILPQQFSITGNFHIRTYTFTIFFCMIFFCNVYGSPRYKLIWVSKYLDTLGFKIIYFGHHRGWGAFGGHPMENLSVRVVGSYLKQGGQVVMWGEGHNLAPLVDIGCCNDLPKPWWVIAHVPYPPISSYPVFTWHHWLSSVLTYLAEV